MESVSGGSTQSSETCESGNRSKWWDQAPRSEKHSKIKCGSAIWTRLWGTRVITLWHQFVPGISNLYWRLYLQAFWGLICPCLSMILNIILHCTEPLSSTIPLFSNSTQMLHRNFHEWQVCWQTKKNEHLQQCVYFPLEIFLTLKHLIYWHFVVVQQIISPKRTLWGILWPFKGLPSNNPENRQIYSFLQDCHQIILKNADNPASSLCPY